LRVWELAMELVAGVYAQTRGFPKEDNVWTDESDEASSRFYSEQHCRRQRTSDGSRPLSLLLSRARVELETQVLIAQHLKYAVPSEAERPIAKCTQRGRMLNAIIHSLKNPENSETPAA
jgi:four helix bundle protein